MNAKTLAIAALLAFVAISVVYLGVNRPVAPDPAPVVAAAAPASATPEAAATIPAATAPHYVAYYFMTNVRCPSCLEIEQYTAETLQSDFAEPLETGRLAWRVVNTDEPENRHFIDDYQLHTKSVVVVELDGDRQVRWKNLEKVWELVGTREGFHDYIAGEMNAFMTGS